MYLSPVPAESIYGCSYNGHMRAVYWNATWQIWKPETCVWGGHPNFTVKQG